MLCRAMIVLVLDLLLHAFADVQVHRSCRVGHVVFAVFCIVGWPVSCSGPVELSQLGSLEVSCWHLLATRLLISHNKLLCMPSSSDCTFDMHVRMLVPSYPALLLQCTSPIVLLASWLFALHQLQCMLFLSSSFMMCISLIIIPGAGIEFGCLNFVFCSIVFYCIV